MNELVQVNKSKTMSSIELVEIINEVRKDEGKKELRHADFMAKLEKHPGIDSTKFFAQYKDSTGRTLKCFQLPKRECELMVMSESLAVQTKVYDRMTELEGKQDTLALLPPDQRALVALMVDNAIIKAKQIEQDETIKRIEARQSAIENGAQYFTVIGFGVHRGLTFSLSDATALGRRAAALSKAAGVTIDQVPDPRFGRVGSYHISMLDAALAELHGGM